MTRPRALISTIEPIDGGVPTMTRCLAGMLEDLGIEPVFAWYEPWSRRPDLSVPLPSLLRGRRPGERSCTAYGDHEAHGLGAWLPELEFTHYLPRRSWRDLIDSCRWHLAVTGNPLCAVPYARLGLPFLAWVATPWAADRSERVRTFSTPRRMLDRGLNAPVLRRLERSVLRAPGARILALSAYTAAELEAIAGRPMEGVLLMPVDTQRYRPDPSRTRPWRLGFCGRWLDPRKDIDLLLRATSLLLKRGHPVELVLAGENDPEPLRARWSELGLDGRVVTHPHLGPEDLARVLQGLDLFVIPSHQEGLCIAALEAMACGVPVVSTRCGGPQTYVLPDRTGLLVDRDAEALAAAVAGIVADRSRRDALGAGALSWVRENATPEAARRLVHRHLEALAPLLYTVAVV
ncbi:MAG: glycosyltransferase family 4 protein [Cyanobium sp.]